MKEIRLSDASGDGTILMCEKHFRKYHKLLDDAIRGGTSYTAKSVKRRGCVMCGREGSGASPWCGIMWKVYTAALRANENS